jgi:N-acetylglucosaminyl-diphospho-decaprenol L-rhamnosyltransferase
VVEDLVWSGDLSIVIVSWNVRDYLAACLESIHTHAGDLRLEVIVVDSYSDDGSVELVRSRYPWVRLFPQSSNVGFTRGNNIGLAASQGRHLMLLNPDTEIVDDALTQMVSYMDDNPRVGIIGPRTLNSDGTTQSTRRRFPTLLTAVFESTWLQSWARCRVLDHFYARDLADTATANVDWVQGSALMIRRKVYGQIGGLDEQYIMFSEELDWCRRARNAGWNVVYMGSAAIIHHGGKSTEQVTALKHIYFQSSKLRYFRKFHGPVASLALRIFIVASYAEQLILEQIKCTLGHKRDLRRERMRIYWQVIRSLAVNGNHS